MKKQLLITLGTLSIIMGAPLYAITIEELQQILGTKNAHSANFLSAYNKIHGSSRDEKDLKRKESLVKILEERYDEILELTTSINTGDDTNDKRLKRLQTALYLHSNLGVSDQARQALSKIHQEDKQWLKTKGTAQ